MKKKLLLLLLPLCLLFSCKDKREETLVGSWQMASMTTSGVTMTAEELANPRFEFKEDHDYLIHFGGKEEKGKWKLKKEKLIMEDLSNQKNSTQELLIDSMGDRTMLYHTINNGLRVDVLLVKTASEEEDD
jgi:hypothetical protein